MKALGAITGISELPVLRQTQGQTTLGYIARAVKLAVKDAGLEKNEIDGLLVGPQVGETPQHVPATVAEYLGIQPTMSNVVDLGGASGAGMIWRAAAAIAMGQCENVVCVLANVREEEMPRSPNRNPIREFDVPFGASGANTSYALAMQRHMDKYGSTPEQFARIAVVERENAQLNKNAFFYGKKITVEDVLNSPIISAPLHLLEIVMPVAGGAAVVVTNAKNARRAPHPAISILGAGEKITHRAMSQAPNLTSGPLKPAVATAMKQAKLGLDDIGLFSLYDCYTVMVALTLEDIGLCPPGAFGSWMSNHDFSAQGDYPLNTHGGQLGCGQADLAGGMGHVIEAVRQLRYQAGARQIPDIDHALITGNGATISEASALVLGRMS